MNIHCLGINHRTAPIEVREKLWFSNEELPAALSIIREHSMNEAVLVSTCNRTELYYVPGIAGPNGRLPWEILAGLKSGTGEITEKFFYTLSGTAAVKHIFGVVSGIDSMVLGDVQISGQLKEAFRLAQELQSTGIILNRLFPASLHVGKRARTETQIGEGAVSISYAAAELATKIFEDLSRRSALLIGAGETGKLTAKHIRGRNLGSLIVANRTRRHAEELAAGLDGSVIDFDHLHEELRTVDIVISAVNSPDHILTANDLRQAMKQRNNRPLFIIDIGVPRNIDPASNTIDNIFLHDIDALEHIVDLNLGRRQAEVPKVEQIILHELATFEAWYNSLEVSPTIQELRDQLEMIRLEEVGKHLHHFDSEKQEEIEIMTKRIVNKILHTPIVNLKNGSGTELPDDAVRTKVYLIRHLFGLDKKQKQ